VVALPTVTVKATAPVSDRLGTDTVDMGPLGRLKRLDTPYSVDVVPQEVLQSQQLRSVVDVLRYLPSVQGDGARPQSRGVAGSVVQNSRIDGMYAVSTTDYSSDEFEQVEVLNGLSGAIYGPANPAGTFNFIQKRPTEDRLMRFTLGYGLQSRFQRGVDISDRMGPDKTIGYRVTASDETGTGYTDNSSIRRQLVSLAFDFHLSPSTVIETNFTHYHYVALGLPASFSLANSGVKLPSALDASNAAYASRNGGNDDTTDTATVRIKHDFNANWHITAGVLRQTANRESSQPTFTLNNNAGAYTSRISTTTASQFTITSNQVSLDGVVRTGPIEHDVSLGTSGFIWNQYNPINGAAAVQGTGNIYNAYAFNLSGTPNYTARYESASVWQQSLIVADHIILLPKWSVLLAGSQSWLGTTNYAKTGNQTAGSESNGLSGAASLIFKPRSNMTTYITYADSLQQGDSAPAGTANANTILAPYRSKQWEVGYKVALGGLNVQIDAFRIVRPYAYANSVTNIYAVAGEQRNKGVELMMDGQVTHDLSLLGGVAYLDPRLFNTGSAATNGSRIVGLPHFAMNMLAIYKVPVLPGLSASFNAHYISARPTDDQGVNAAAGYATFDLSASYQTVLLGRLTTFSVGVYNLSNKQYWTNIYQGGLGSYTTSGTSTASLGAPRQVEATLHFEL
jgi:iron complex outermembrane receptor protein